MGNIYLIYFHLHLTPLSMDVWRSGTSFVPVCSRLVTISFLCLASRKQIHGKCNPQLSRYLDLFLAGKKIVCLPLMEIARATPLKIVTFVMDCWVQQNPEHQCGNPSDTLNHKPSEKNILHETPLSPVGLFGGGTARKR